MLRCEQKANELIPMKVPYTQQFTPKVTPLSRLIPILPTNAGNPKDLKKGIAAAFFSKSPDPAKMAGNTLIALRNCGILGDGDNLTDLGQDILNSQDNIDEAHRILARHILLQASITDHEPNLPDVIGEEHSGLSRGVAPPTTITGSEAHSCASVRVAA